MPPRTSKDDSEKQSRGNEIQGRCTAELGGLSSSGSDRLGVKDRKALKNGMGITLAPVFKCLGSASKICFSAPNLEHLL